MSGTNIKWPLIAIADEDRDRNQRAVQAVQKWAHEVDVFITVDDASNIVNEVVKAWRADNRAEVEHDFQTATDRLRPYGRGD
jgi:hypothetical protein